MGKLSTVSDAELSALRELASDVSGDSHDLARRLEHGSFNSVPANAAALATAYTNAALGLLECSKQLLVRMGIESQRQALENELRQKA